MTKTDFDNKLTSFNTRITSNKAKHLEVQKKLDSLITKDYSFFSGWIYFTSNYGSQNMFVYQPTFNMLVLVVAWFRAQLTINLTSGNQGVS